LKTDKRRFELKEFGPPFKSNTTEITRMNRTGFHGHITDRAQVISPALHVEDLLGMTGEMGKQHFDSPEKEFLIKLCFSLCHRFLRGPT
jgi:hypothetical protein